MPELLAVPTHAFSPGQLSDQAGAGWKRGGLEAAAAGRVLEGPCQAHNGGDPLANSLSEWGQQAASASKGMPPIWSNTGPRPGSGGWKSLAIQGEHY